MLIPPFSHQKVPVLPLFPLLPLVACPGLPVTKGLFANSLINVGQESLPYSREEKTKAGAVLTPLLIAMQRSFGHYQVMYCSGQISYCTATVDSI